MRSAMLAALVLIFVLFGALEPVLAAPSQAEKARARKLMDDGDALVEQKDYTGALEKYRQAHAIMDVTTTGIEVARTLARLGRLVEAKRSATAVASTPAAAGEPQAFAQARADAAALAQELDRRVPRLTVEARGLAAGATWHLEIDGKAVPASDNTSAHELDPGSHVVSGEASSGTASLRVALKEGERQTVTLTFATTASDEPERGAPTPVQPSKDKSPTAGYVIAGVGLAGLAVAAVTSVLYVRQHQKIKDECPDAKCTTDAGYDRVESNRRLGVINAVAWGVGLVGTGVGGYLILTHSPKEKTAVAPAWSRRGVSLTLHHSF